jgi:hypothetical protein
MPLQIVVGPGQHQLAEYPADVTLFFNNIAAKETPPVLWNKNTRLCGLEN